MTGSKGLRMRWRADNPLSNGMFRSSLAPLDREKNRLKDHLPHSGRLLFWWYGHPRTPKDTSKCTHSHSTHAITTISHKNNFTHSHTHAHTCTTQTPSMHPTHSNNSIQTHKHHSASSFHFISIQPIPSITKLKNSTTNNIPPSLLISTFTLSKHHFTPILIYFIHHINTKKYLQLLYSNST